MLSIRPTPRGGHPLHRAAENESVLGVRKLAPGRSRSQYRRSGGPSLRCTWPSNPIRPKRRSYLLEAKADPNAPDKDGATPLHYAASNRSPDVAQRLLDAGADPNTADREGRTPIDVAPAPDSTPDRERVARGPRTTAGARS